MEYYVAKGNQQTGPFTYEAMASVGVTPETLIWATGWPTWKPASQVPEMAPLLQGSTPPPIPAQVTLGGATAPPPIPTAPAAAPRPAGAGNPMFRGVRVPGYQAAAPVSQVASPPAAYQAPVSTPSQPVSQPQPYQPPVSQPQPYQTPASQPVQKVQPQPSQPSQPSQSVPTGETSVVKSDNSASDSSSNSSSSGTEVEGTYKPSLTSPWLWQSILMTILCFPFGLLPLYFSLQTKKANEMGDTELAKGLSEQTLKYLRIVLVVGGVLWTIFSYFGWKINYQ